MPEFSSILVTTDFSDQSLPGLQSAASLAHGLGAQVTVVYIVEDHLPPIIPFTSEEDRQAILEKHRDEASRKLEAYIQTHLTDLPVTASVLVGVAAEEIVRLAATICADMIVMASRGYGPIRQLVLGSTTERVLHHASCPVLVVNSQ